MLFCLLIVAVGCAPKTIPGPEGAQDYYSKGEKVLTDLGERGLQGPPDRKENLENQLVKKC